MKRTEEAATEILARREARKSLVKFTEFTYPRYKANWHHEIIGNHLEKVTSGEIENLMVFAPPRHGKSELIDIRWPAWDLGHDPAGHFIGTAYGDELATTFSRGCRNVIDSPDYQRLWRLRFKEKADTKWQLKRKDDDHRATFLASGILGALTGEGATKLIIDDPVKNEEEAYSKRIRDKIDNNFRTVVSTRLAPGGRKVLVMTRWHEDDLAGRLLKRSQEDKRADQWTVVVLAATNDEGTDSYIWNTASGEKKKVPAYKALWPQAYPREKLDGRRADIGETFWSALYMQRPTAPAGQIFKRENWGYFDSFPPIDFLIQVYDGACEEGQENDFSASITLASGKSGFSVFDAWRDKLAFPYLMAKVYERWQRAFKQYGRFPDRLVVENKSSGIQIAQQLEANNQVGVWTFPTGVTERVPFIPITKVPATQSKVLRAQGISGYHESKLVKLPRGADWHDDFVDEHGLFPKGPHDDWVDCTVHGVTFYTRPVEEQSQIISHDEPVVISSDLDDFDYRENW